MRIIRSSDKHVWITWIERKRARLKRQRKPLQQNIKKFWRIADEAYRQLPKADADSVSTFMEFSMTGIPAFLDGYTMRFRPDWRRLRGQGLDLMDCMISIWWNEVRNGEFIHHHVKTPTPRRYQLFGADHETDLEADFDYTLPFFEAGLDLRDLSEFANFILECLHCEPLDACADYIDNCATKHLGENAWYPGPVFRDQEHWSNDNAYELCMMILRLLRYGARVKSSYLQNIFRDGFLCYCNEVKMDLFQYIQPWTTQSWTRDLTGQNSIASSWDLSRCRWVLPHQSEKQMVMTILLIRNMPYHNLANLLPIEVWWMIFGETFIDPSSLLTAINALCDDFTEYQ